MDVLEELACLTEAIRHEKSILDAMIKNRIKWCQENSYRIKKLYPKLGKIYQIIDDTAAHNYYSMYGMHLREGVHYFRPTDIRFYPHKDFQHEYEHYKLPTVIGDILDCNLKVIASTQVYITSIKEIEKENHPLKSGDVFTYVYLMIDKNTGYYKIGRSKRPSFREKTLQSEKPTVELLHSFEAEKKDEKELHSMFSHKRIRGEWFDLSGSDIETVKNYFSIDVSETYS